MNVTLIPESRRVIRNRAGNFINSASRSLVLRQLSGVRLGELRIDEGDRQWRFGRSCDAFPCTVTVRVLHPSTWTSLAFGGTVGAGESYIAGDWVCEQLTDLVRLFLRNGEAMANIEGGLSWFGRPVRRFGHWLQRNTLRGSRRNIEAHYDIGNALFRLFLDENLMYSSAYYPTEGSNLDQAATTKLDRVCRKLGLTPQHHLLEIGSGWGGLALHAARNFGCRVTTTTISQEQFELTRQRVAEEGLSDRIEVLNVDYRELRGSYDRVVSIEMIEAVGHQFLSGYFAQCSRLLKADGYMLIQAITIRDQLYRSALRDIDFIKQFIFPGGFLPSVTAMTEALTKATDLRITHLEDIGLHYVKTLQDWRTRFMERLDDVKALGYSDAFIRLWEFYLCYSEGGFAEHHLGTVQLVASKPGAPPADIRY